MNLTKRSFFACLALLLAPIVFAQENQEPTKAPRKLTPLQIQVVFSKHLNDKKVSSIPYTLLVNADDPRPTKLRMGIEVPVTLSKEKPQAQYRTVGTNIDCGAETVEPGRYKVNLNVEQSSVYPDPSGAPSNLLIADMPLFRSFNLNFSVLLKDSESVDRAAATDPVTGEVLKISVALNVVK